MKIGFIGLGIMGKPMAKNVLKAGYDLTVFDINKDAVKELVEGGAKEATSNADLASKVDVVITMLPNSPHVKSVVLGENGVIEGVMGFQEKNDVNLIRHAYVRTNIRNRGIGGLLLEHLREFSKKPILIGTWADASWAIRFYEKHDFQIVVGTEKDQLLKKYWTIPERQVETSVVLKELSYCSAGI